MMQSTEVTCETHTTHPRVTIVVPVYNTEKYLSQCLDSIARQTFTDYELICVDDSSTDNSIDIISSYAKNDDRIILLRNPGKGAADARNFGLDHASGDYIIFLDSDDFFVETMIEETLSLVEEHQADLVIFAGRRFDESTGKTSNALDFCWPSEKVNNPFSKKELPDDLFQITYPGPCAKLFKASLIEKNRLRFEHLANTEDVSFVLAAMAAAESIVAVQSDFYRYRVNTGTSTEDTKESDPTCFVTALKTLKTRLGESGSYDIVEKSFLKQSLNIMRYQLRSSASQNSRFAVIDALGSPQIAELGVLDLPEEQYGSLQAYTDSRFILSAIQQRNGDDEIPFAEPYRHVLNGESLAKRALALDNAQAAPLLQASFKELYEACQIVGTLNEGDKGALLALTDLQRELLSIANLAQKGEKTCSEMEIELKNLRKANTKLNNELSRKTSQIEKIKSSRSYKLARRLSHFIRPFRSDR